MGSTAWHEHTDCSSFPGGVDRSTVNVPKILSYRLCTSFSRFGPAHMRGSPQVCGAVGHRVVVGARQVVVGDGFEVNWVIMAVGGAHPTRGFVEGVGQKEVRTGQHPVASV